MMSAPWLITARIEPTISATLKADFTTFADVANEKKFAWLLMGIYTLFYSVIISWALAVRGGHSSRI